MSLQVQDINKIRQDKDDRARSNFCLKCGMISHFVRDCTAGTVDPADDNVSPVVGKCKKTVTADYSVKDVFLYFLFKEFINQNNITKKAYKIRQKACTVGDQTKQ